MVGQDQGCIVIIGGGIIGVTSAFMLKWRNPNQKVTLLESSQIAGECSHQNGGSLNYIDNTPWGNIWFMSHFFKGLFQKNSLVTVDWQTLLDPRFWIFGMRLMSSYFRYNQIAHASYMLGERTHDIHLEIKRDLQEQFPDLLNSYGGQDSGVMEVFGSQADIDEWVQESERINTRYGQNIKLHSPEECRQLEPGLKYWKPKIVGCLTNTKQSFASHDSLLLTQAFAEMAKELGVEIITEAHVNDFKKVGKQVKAVVLDGGKEIEVDKLVIAAGYRSKELAAKLGWSLPLWPVKGYSINYDWEYQFEHAIHNTTDIMWLNKTPRGYRSTWFLNFTPYSNKEIEQDKLDVLKQHVLNTVEGKIQFRDPWVCFRPVSADDLALIGKFPGFENVYLNAGQGGRGSFQSLACAELLEQLIMKKETFLDPYEYRPDRFYF